MQQRKFYNLDGLRFFAALFVVINHTESFKAFFHLPSFADVGFFKQAGSLAVKFFFVLSGFLITYYLLIEQKEKQAENRKINLLAFYKKRIVRIWPLYYALIICTFFALPHFELLQYPGYNSGFVYIHFKSFLLYLFFLPNLSLFLQGNVLYLGQLWSLSVEEFFYLYFPLLIYFSNTKSVFKYFIGSLIIYFIVAALYFLWQSHFDQNQNSLLHYLFITYQLYIFLFGAIAAKIYLTIKENALIFKYETQLKIAAYLVFAAATTAIIYSYLIPESGLKTLFYPTLFALLILLLCLSNVNIRLLNWRPIVYFGKISYGIYMLHPIAIVVCLKLFPVHTGFVAADTFLFDAITITCTILLASATYYLLEKPFMRMIKRV